MVILLFPTLCLGFPRGSVSVDPNSVVFVEVLGKAVGCVNLGGVATVGKLKNNGLFRSYSEMKKGTGKKIRKKKAAGDTTAVKKLKKKKRKFGQFDRKGTPICQAALGGGGPLPTPTPTPNPSERNFDSQGNVTNSGKIAFGIPSVFEGNISRGKLIYDSFCSCHTDAGKQGRQFDTYRANIAGSPMFFNEKEVPDSMLAHLTAYLNRFNF